MDKTDKVLTIVITAYILIDGRLLNDNWSMPEYIVADESSLYLISDRRITEEDLKRCINRPTQFIYNRSKGAQWLTPIDYKTTPINSRPI